MRHEPDESSREAEGFFVEACRLQAQARAEFLERLRDDAPDVCRRVEALLEAARMASGGVASDSTVTEGSKPVAIGGRLGPYRLEAQLGQGGQGAVFRAQDTRLGRKVAIKVLSATQALSPTSRLRFQREAEVASKLDHPGIASVYEVGEIEGVPYIAMRYVSGSSLASRLAAARATEESADTDTFVDVEGPADPATKEVEPTPAPTTDVTAAVRLIEEAAHALHVAHEAGLVHRDIKPANILLDADGRPVICDFGLARAEESDFQTLTQSGDLMGTPAYMSPEQLTRQSIRVDRRTDVYSLGATLYECLTLRRPFESPTRELLYQAILTKEAADPRTINSDIPKDLAVILATALEKDRDRRYQTAQALAEYLRRCRVHEPIAARPAGMVLRFRRWVRRNRALAASGFTIAASLIGGLILSLYFVSQLKTERDEKGTALKTAAEEARLKATALEDVKRESDAARRNLAVAYRNAHAASGSSRERLMYAAAAVDLLDDPDGRGLMLRAANEQREPLWTTGRRYEDVRRVVASPDGRHVGLIGASRLRVMSVTSGRVVLDVSRSAPLRGGVAAPRDGFPLAFFPDGRFVISACHDQTVRVWDVVSGEERLRLVGHRESVLAVAANSDGLIASADRNGHIKVWSWPGGEVVAAVRSGADSVRHLQWDGLETRVLHAWSEDEVLRSWDVAQERQLRAIDLENVVGLTRSEGGALLALTSFGSIKLRDVVRNRVIVQCTPESEPTVVAPLADGSGFVWSEENELWRCDEASAEPRLWGHNPGDTGTEAMAHLAAHDRTIVADYSGQVTIRSSAGAIEAMTPGRDLDGLVRSLTFSRGELIAANSTEIARWDAMSGRNLGRWDAPRVFTIVGGNIVFVGRRGGSVRVADVRTPHEQRELGRIELDGGSCVAVAANTSMTHIVIATARGRVVILDAESGTVTEVRPRDGRRLGQARGGLVVSPEADEIVVNNSIGSIEIWTRKAKSGWRKAGEYPSDMAVSYELHGRRRANWSSDRITVFDRDSDRKSEYAGRNAILLPDEAIAFSTGDHLTVTSMDSGRVDLRVEFPNAVAIAVSEAGDQLAAVSVSGRIGLWQIPASRADVEESPRLLELSGDGSSFVPYEPADSATVGRDLESGKATVVIATFDVIYAAPGVNGDVLLFDGETRQRLRTLTGHLDRVVSACFSPSGDRLVTADGKNRIRIWDPGSGSLVRDIDDATNSPLSFAFAPSGAWLAIAVDDVIAILDPKNGRTRGVLRGHPVIPWSLSPGPSSSTLTSCGKDGVTIWDVESLKSVRHFEVSGNRAILAPAEDRLVITSTRSMEIRDVSGGAVLARFAPPLPSFSRFSDDSQHLIGTTRNGEPLSWSLDCLTWPSGECLERAARLTHSRMDAFDVQPLEPLGFRFVSRR